METNADAILQHCIFHQGAQSIVIIAVIVMLLLLFLVASWHVDRAWLRSLVNTSCGPCHSGPKGPPLEQHRLPVSFLRAASSLTCHVIGIIIIAVGILPSPLEFCRRHRWNFAVAVVGILPSLFVDERKIITQVEVPNDAMDVDQQVCFENKRKHIHFYYMPKEGEIPDCPTSGAAWQYFYDNNKIKSRSNRMKRATRGVDDKERQQEGNRPRLNTTTPRATAENTTNRPTMMPTPATRPATAAPPSTAAAAPPPLPPQAVVLVPPPTVQRPPPPPAAGAPTPPSPPAAARRTMGDIIGSFWDDTKKKKIFNAPDAMECAEAVLHRQIDLLGKALNDAKMLKKIVNKAADHPLDARQVLELSHKCMYLRKAYTLALNKMPNGMLWISCCIEAVEQMIWRELLVVVE
jgi:hypothetical protein